MCETVGMAWFEDLSEWTYLGGDSSRLRAVGWLEAGHPFATAPVPPGFVARLEALQRIAWQPIVAAGPHFCDLCPKRGAAGSENLWLPSKEQELVFVAPELISHYVSAHGYQPPSAFIDAVLACPWSEHAQFEAAVSRLWRLTSA